MSKKLLNNIVLNSCSICGCQEIFSFDFDIGTTIMLDMICSFSNLQSAVELMSQEIRKQDFLTYFKKFSLVSATDTSVTIGVVSSFHLDNLSKKFYDDIKRAIIKIVPTVEVVDFAIDDTIDMRPLDQVIDCRDIQKQSEKQAKKELIEGVQVVE